MPTIPRVSLDLRCRLNPGAGPTALSSSYSVCRACPLSLPSVLLPPRPHRCPESHLGSREVRAQCYLTLLSWSRRLPLHAIFCRRGPISLPLSPLLCSTSPLVCAYIGLLSRRKPPLCRVRTLLSCFGHKHVAASPQGRERDNSGRQLPQHSLHRSRKLATTNWRCTLSLGSHPPTHTLSSVSTCKRPPFVGGKITTCSLNNRNFAHELSLWVTDLVKAQY